MISKSKKDVYIIGGGASGVLCAIEASKKYHVHIIEKNDKLMKKLLITGNGSCNFSNKALKDKYKYKDRYNNDFILDVYDRFSYDDLLRYLSDIGIYHMSKTRYDETYIYPYDYNSKSVYYNLMDMLKVYDVDIIYNQEVKDIKKDTDGYTIITTDKKYNASIVVISTGGKSYQKTGSDGKMLDILKDMGLHIIEPIPSLCPLYHNDSTLKDLKGIRTECDVSVKVDGSIRYKEYGEVQFNESSLSGIPILNASCRVGRNIYNHDKVSISIDFIKDICDASFFKKRQKD
ncbi:MAG: aminoacetone oxidase family FAD-binding enzyme, partial [Lachnospiraceae bacterium]|nr:aminoacetone oxidase family FAD-binding enzyme [Lachnospiraceae bacterium]